MLLPLQDPQVMHILALDDPATQANTFVLLIATRLIAAQRFSALGHGHLEPGGLRYPS